MQVHGLAITHSKVAYLQWRLSKCPARSIRLRGNALLNCCRAPVLAEEVIRSIRFAPSVKSIAQKILDHLSDTKFDALHLRVEDDLRAKSDADPAEVRKVNINL